MSQSGQAAMVVTMTLDPDRGPEVTRHFADDVLPWAKRQGGFVSGHWIVSPDGGSGIGIVVFDSLDLATAASAGPRAQAHDDTRAWNTDRVDLFHVAANS